MTEPKQQLRTIKDIRRNAEGELVGKLSLQFHEGQLEVLDSTKRFVLMLAGAQSGKTSFGPHWLLREIQEKGPGDYLAVTATFPLMNLKMLIEFKYVFEELFHLGTYKESLNTFIFHDRQTRVIFGSATNPESIEAATAKAAWLDEAGQKQFRRDAWEAIRRRLSIHQGRALFTTTLYTLGWLKTELYDKWQAGDPDIDVIQFASTINPLFPKEEFHKAQATMPKWKFDMFYRGQYSTPAGLIYDSFDDSVCKIPRRNIPPEWPRYVGLDFGTVNMAAVWFAEDPATSYLYAYREYLSGGRSAYEHAAEFKELSAGETILKSVGGSHQEQGWRDAFTAVGWPISESCVREVEVGIDKVYALHKQNKLFVFDDLHEYLDEKLSYSRELDDNYNPTEKIENKERYHLMDSERYIVSDFFPQAVLSGGTDKIHVQTSYGPSIGKRLSNRVPVRRW